MRILRSSRLWSRGQWVVGALSLWVAASAQAAPDGGLVDAPDAGSDPAVLVGMVDDALARLARSRNKEALVHLRAGEVPEALAAIREALELGAEDPEIVNNAGYLYHQLGNLEEAERLYRKALTLQPDRYVALINLADLITAQVATPERLEEAANRLTRARELRGNNPSVILRQARVAARRGRFDEAQRFFKERLAAKPPDDALRLEIGDLHRDFGAEEEALSWYRQITDRGAIGEEAHRHIREVEVARTARKFGWTGPQEEIPAQARSLAARANQLLAEGQIPEARRLLEQALSEAPQFADARADLGSLLLAEGEVARAELELLRALSVEQGSAEIHARLGRLYLGQPDRAGEARVFLGRALQMRPDRVDLHLPLAQAHRAAGDLPRALSHVERFLSTGSPGAGDKKRAGALKADIVQLLPEEARPGADAARVDLAGRDLAATLSRAKAMVSRGEPEAAMAELRRLSQESRGVEVLTLEARILLAAGREAEAIVLLNQAIELEGEAPALHALMGRALLATGQREAARKSLRTAAALGAHGAIVDLARLDEEAASGSLGWLSDAASAPRLVGVRSQLKAALARPLSAHERAEAQTLLQQVDTRLWRAGIVGGGLILLLGLGGLLSWRRRWGGCTLTELLAQHPEAGPEVQRILSAVRHEVLKHNTMMLTGVVEALELGESANEKAAHARRSLFGTGQGDQSVYDRLKDYAEQLTQVARGHELRLNLRRRDPAFSALIAGFEALARIAPDLDRIEGLSNRRRGAVQRTLERAAHQLNEEGYGAIQALLDQLRVLEISRDLLMGLFDRTVREPAFQAATIAPLHLDIEPELPLSISIPRQPFEDILTNLIRNALQSGLRHGQGVDPGEGLTPVALSIGLGLRTEVDPITGLERVLFLIRDRSPQRLTREMLRGRYIEEGLGLTADLVSRYDGTLDVIVGETDWHKAVVVKLPRVYEGESDAASGAGADEV